MKHTVQKNPADFTPVSLTVTFESQKELDAFTSMCNCSPICDSMEKHGCSIFHLVDGLERMGGNPRRVEPLCDLVSVHFKSKTSL